MIFIERFVKFLVINYRCDALLEYFIEKAQYK